MILGVFGDVVEKSTRSVVCLQIPRFKLGMFSHLPRIVRTASFWLSPRQNLTLKSPLPSEGKLLYKNLLEFELVVLLDDCY
jgi:hypothetical protein